MRRARIKAIANIPVTRRPARGNNEKFDDKKTDQIKITDQESSDIFRLQNLQTKQDMTKKCNIKSVTDIETQFLEQLQSCNERDTNSCESNKVTTVLVKPKQAETLDVREINLLKVDEGSYQNECKLTNLEDSEKFHTCVSNAIKLYQVCFLSNEIKTTEKQNVPPVTARNDSIKNLVNKFKVGVNEELVADQSEYLQANFKNNEYQKSLSDEKMITKPIIIDDTLYSSGFAHNYTRCADSSKEMKRKKPLLRNDLSNTLRKSLVGLDYGKSRDEITSSYHDNQEKASQKLKQDTFFPTVEQELEQNFEPPNNNRVTIHDVIHTKLYARFPKQICTICNGVGCTAEHEALSQTDRALGEGVVQRVKVGSNGQLIIDENESFSGNKRFSIENPEVPTFDDMGGYRKRTMGGWNSESSSKFLKALKVFGTDFDMMKSWFPDKSRYQLYRKFKKEEKKNSTAVDDILRNQNFDADAVQEGIDVLNRTRTETATAETVNLQKQTERRNGKLKKRKIRGLVLKSIEMSSTDEETDSEEIKAHQKFVATDDTLIVSHHSTQHLNTNRTSVLDNKLRYKEMSSILKEMKSKQEERLKKLNKVNSFS